MEKTEVTTELMDSDELNSQTFNEQKIPKINIQAIDDTLTMDSYSQYVSDSQNRVIRVLGSTYCSGLIDFKGMKFLIMDQPARANLPSFLNELKKNHVKHVFRVCTSTYSPQDLEKDGVYVYDLPFDDGGYPEKEIIDEWLALIKKIFTDHPGCTVAVHCVAGLGRAPVMVAIALIECGMKYEEAVTYIRNRRRGAINSRQLEFLERYKSNNSLKFKQPGKFCTIF